MAIAIGIITGIFAFTIAWICSLPSDKLNDMGIKRGQGRD